MAHTADRKKVNFMIDRCILVKMEKLIPPGQRSDFVNKALDEAIVQFGRRKASEGMDKLAKELAAEGFTMSTEEFIRLKNYGRE
ncbi:hypothetical protein HYW82_02540 [Candidatus Peregrinibacteria bacterium]|nr:hypothetical protein [Candidatus Peregrinibacteria bacterium]